MNFGTENLFFFHGFYTQKSLLSFIKFSALQNVLSSVKSENAMIFPVITDKFKNEGFMLF